MWIVRELLRFVFRIAVALLIAIVIAEARALISGGDTLRTFRIVCILMGCLYLLLAAGPAQSLGGRRMNDVSWRITQSLGYGTFEMPHVAVLEIKNLGNFKVALKFKDPIAMMLFAELKDPVTQKIQTQYGPGQNKATAPNLRFRTGHDT